VAESSVLLAGHHHRHLSFLLKQDIKQFVGMNTNKHITRKLCKLSIALETYKLLGPGYITYQIATSNLLKLELMPLSTSNIGN